jgi:hypothetical protein
MYILDSIHPRAVSRESRFVLLASGLYALAVVMLS